MLSRKPAMLACALLTLGTISYAATIVAVTDSTLPLNQGTFAVGGQFRNVVVVSWTQATSVSNATIGASLESSDAAFRTGTAYLMNAIGPGTTTANQVVSPVPFTVPFNALLSGAPVQLTILFTGVNLGPGTYYLLLTAPFSATASGSPIGWKFANRPVVTTAPSVTLGTISLANTVFTTVNSFPPASTFVVDSVDRIIFDVFAGSQVIFLGTDTTTAGNWPVRYGAGGYVIPNDVATTLDHTNVSFSEFFNYTWAPLTSDPRALRTSPVATSGIASAVTNFFGRSFNINLNNYDTKPHTVSLYLLDWDTTSRSQTVTITDASTGELYDTRTFSNFRNGVYAAWQLRGNLTIKVTPTSGPSAVVSGIFID